MGARAPYSQFPAIWVDFRVYPDPPTWRPEIDPFSGIGRSIWLDPRFKACLGGQVSGSMRGQDPASSPARIPSEYATLRAMAKSTDRVMLCSCKTKANCPELSFDSEGFTIQDADQPGTGVLRVTREEALLLVEELRKRGIG